MGSSRDLGDEADKVEKMFTVAGNTIEYLQRPNGGNICGWERKPVTTMSRYQGTVPRYEHLNKDSKSGIITDLCKIRRKSFLPTH